MISGYPHDHPAAAGLAKLLMAVMDSHTPSGVLEVMKMAKLHMIISTISSKPGAARARELRLSPQVARGSADPFHAHVIGDVLAMWLISIT